MDQSEIKFGDKIFLYGQFLEKMFEFPNPQYNSVVGYMTVGGYHVRAIETYVFGASLPGFVADFLVSAQFTVAPPFSQMEMVDVTDRLSHSLPLLSGTKVWLPQPNF